MIAAIDSTSDKCTTAVPTSPSAAEYNRPAVYSRWDNYRSARQRNSSG